MSARERLDTLLRANPEWRPWLDIVGAVLPALEPGAWDSALPSSRAGGADAPRLAGVTAPVPASAIDAQVERLRAAAVGSGAPAYAPLAQRVFSRSEAAALFAAGVNHDASGLDALAQASGVERPALHALAALAATPFLHACRRAWGESVRARWSEGYCGVCGAWPSFVEVRGVERARFLRCGRCGEAWSVPCLSCTYCGTSDHERLGSFVVGEPGARSSAIEVCNACRGYVKSFTTLTGAFPETVMLDDLASAVLDVLALERGYRRRDGVARALEVRVSLEAQ